MMAETSEMHKTADFHWNLLVSWELVTEGYDGRDLWNAQNSWFPLKSVSISGIGDWRLSSKTYEKL